MTGNVKYPRRLRQFFTASMAFGMVMGFVFPYFADLFVERPEGLRWLWFRLGCVAAGLSVGLITYMLARYLIIGFLRSPVEKLRVLFGGMGGKNAGSRKTDPLQQLRSNLDEANGFLINAAMGIRETETAFRSMTKRSVSILGQIAQVTVRQRELAGITTELMRGHVGRMEDLEGAFRLQDEVTDSVQARIADLGEELGRLAGEIRSAQERNAQSGEEIQAESERYLGVIDELGTTAKMIEGIAQDIGGVAGMAARSGEDVKVIGDIAERTEILAINANIEAARAGKTVGDGFRVIAGSITELTDRTRKTADEILENMSSLTERTREMTEEADKRIAILREYRKEADSARETQERIVRNVASTNERNDKVYDALLREEQEMKALLDQSSRMSESEEELASLIEDVKKSYQTLSEHSDDLIQEALNQEDAARSIGELYREMEKLVGDLGKSSSRFHLPEVKR